MIVGTWTVTCWRYYPQGDGPPPEPWHLGGLLRELHGLATPPVELPRYNLLWDGARVVLGDWDEASVGPRELDLVNTYQGVRFGRTERQLREFAEAYDYDVTQWPGFSTLRAIRDLHTLGAYLRRGDQGDRLARQQVMHRVETLRQHGCQSSPNMSGGVVAPYGFDVARFTAELNAFKGGWRAAIHAKL